MSNVHVPPLTLLSHTNAGDGSYGQLGDGKSIPWAPNSFQGITHQSSVPVEVLGGHSFAAVYAGGGHSCGLEPSGQAWCWGAQAGGLCLGRI